MRTCRLGPPCPVQCPTLQTSSLSTAHEVARNKQQTTVSPTTACQFHLIVSWLCPRTVWGSPRGAGAVTPPQHGASLPHQGSYSSHIMVWGLFGSYSRVKNIDLKWIFFTLMNEPRQRGTNYIFCVLQLYFYLLYTIRCKMARHKSAFCSGPKLSSLQDIHFITKILLSSDKYYKHFQRSVDINFPNVYKVKLVYKLIQFANAVHFRSTIRMHPSFGTFHFIINIALWNLEPLIALIY